MSVLFIPAPMVKNAALEAIDAGVKLLVIVPDRVPIYDVLIIADAARSAGARFVGPNTLGMLSPGKAVAGMIGGRAAPARQWFQPGPVGITSRSGGITSSMAATGGFPGITAYTASRAGLLGFTRSLAVELRKDDIRVVMLSPGPADTPMRWAATPDVDPKGLKDTSTIADTISWLASLPRGTTTGEFVLRSVHIEL